MKVCSDSFPSDGQKQLETIELNKMHIAWDKVSEQCFMTKDGNASDPIGQLSSQAFRRLLTSAFVIKTSSRWNTSIGRKHNINDNFRTKD